MKSILTHIVCICVVSHMMGASSAVDLRKLPVEQRVAVLRKVIVKEIAFKDESLLECLHAVSRICAKSTGMGFSVIAKNTEKELKSPIVLKVEGMTVAEILHYLAVLADVSIELKNEGCIVMKNASEDAPTRP